MNESIIKEIKTIYSGRVMANSTPAVTPEIKKTRKKSHKNSTSFFNGVIEKLDILINNKNS